MAHNAKRTARMRQKTAAQLLAVYSAGTLSSAAAAHELEKRGVELPLRDFEKNHPRRIE